MNFRALVGVIKLVPCYIRPLAVLQIWSYSVRYFSRLVLNSPFSQITKTAKIKRTRKCQRSIWNTLSRYRKTTHLSLHLSWTKSFPHNVTNRTAGLFSGSLYMVTITLSAIGVSLWICYHFLATSVPFFPLYLTFVWSSYVLNKFVLNKIGGTKGDKSLMDENAVWTT